MESVIIRSSCNIFEAITGLRRSPGRRWEARSAQDQQGTNRVRSPGCTPSGGPGHRSGAIERT